MALFPEAREQLLNAYRMDPDRVVVIPRGVPTQGFVPADTRRQREARISLGLDPRKRWIAMVGALSDEKDPCMAVEALATLDNEVGLVVAGDGPLERRVRERSASLGDRVALLGAVEDVTAVYAAADSLVLPSRTEGVPGVAIEAGLCGLAVAAFDVGGVSSVVEDVRTGRLVRTRAPSLLAEAVQYTLDRRDQLGPAARAHCEAEFSMEVVGAAWEQIIDRLAPARSRTRGVGE